MISAYKESVQLKHNNGEFAESTTTNNNSFSYTMEVVDIINNIVIAKVIDTKTPKNGFKYRVGDMVEVTK